jgi:hypothetical protein
VAAEVTVTFRDDQWREDNEDYEDWLRGYLEAERGITVLHVELEEV